MGRGGRHAAEALEVESALRRSLGVRVRVLHRPFATDAEAWIAVHVGESGLADAGAARGFGATPKEAAETFRERFAAVQAKALKSSSEEQRPEPESKLKADRAPRMAQGVKRVERRPAAQPEPGPSAEPPPAPAPPEPSQPSQPPRAARRARLVRPEKASPAVAEQEPPKRRRIVRRKAVVEPAKTVETLQVDDALIDRIAEALAERESGMSGRELARLLDEQPTRIDQALFILERDGMVVKDLGRWILG